MITNFLELNIFLSFKFSFSIEALVLFGRIFRKSMYQNEKKIIGIEANVHKPSTNLR